MLNMTTGPVKIVAYRTWEQEGKPVTRKNGSRIEFALYHAEGEFRERETVLDESVNGNRAPVDSVVCLVFETRQEPEARTGRDGRPFVVWTEKRRITEFVPVKA